jgi:dolichyl-phosphooligosaccharide-protein glycotransferase
MNKQTPYLALLGLGLVIGLNIYFRSFPINFPQLAAEARDRVEARYAQRSADLVNKNYPNLSSMAKDSLAVVALQDYLKENRQKMRAEVGDEYTRLKDRYQDKDGHTYLFELDCWHWARYVENTVASGHPGDAVVNGTQRDLLMRYPEGTNVSYNTLLFYVSAFLYKSVRFFVHVPLYTFLFYLPLLFAVIFIGSLYVICWRFYGALAAVICALFVGLAPIFLPRSCAGWFDMDILNLLFPLLVVFAYLMAYSRIKAALRWVWLGTSALLVGLFAYTWVYWWFVVAVIILYEVYSVLDLVSERLQYKTVIRASVYRHILLLCIFVPLCAVSVIAFCGTAPFVELWGQIVGSLTLNDPVDRSIWPNVFSTVGELARPNFNQIASSVGGIYTFILALSCMLVLVLRNKRYRGPKRESIFLFVLSFIIVYVICYKGTRLIVFLLIPMGVFLGWGVREAYNYCMRRRRKKKYLLPVLGIAVVLLVGGFIGNGQRVASGLYPMIDDSWYVLLNNLRQNTPAGAVLNSWWDFGDWFKAIAGRRVIFDGQSQNTPQGYWMAKVLLSHSEEEAMAILRMLNNGGNRAFEEINNHVHDPVQSLLLLEKIVGMDQSAASSVLGDSLPQEAAARVKELLYGRPPAAYFIVDYTLIGKMYPISYLGNWDVSRVYVIKNINTKTKDQIITRLVELGTPPEAAAAMYRDARLLSPGQYNQWISHRARYISGTIPGKRKGDVVLFNNGLVYNIQDRSMFVFNGYDGQYHVPQSLFFLEGDRLTEHVYPDSNLDFSVLLLQDHEGYHVVEMDRELGQSLFTKLYFLKGQGLRSFKLFTDNRDVQNYVGVFEINWTKP